MTKAVFAAIAVLWLSSVVGGHWMSALRSPSSIASNSAEFTGAGGARAGEVTGDPRVERDDSTEAAVDMLGNEVENAVADYRIDNGGDVYERHSPETAVSRLGSPTS